MKFLAKIARRLHQIPDHQGDFEWSVTGKIYERVIKSDSSPICDDDVSFQGKLFSVTLRLWESLIPISVILDVSRGLCFTLTF